MRSRIDPCLIPPLPSGVIKIIIMNQFGIAVDKYIERENPDVLKYDLISSLFIDSKSFDEFAYRLKDELNIGEVEAYELWNELNESEE